VEGKELSKVNINDTIEKNVITAYKMLHKYSIYHGDVRSANIIVRDDDSVVLIDFERGLLNADKMMLIEEEDEVRHMMRAIKVIRS
jgi:RIO-like serine/threonine protein kinase